MENRFKTRISRIFRFRGSFRLCQTARDLLNVVEKPLITPPQQPPPQKDSFFRLNEDPKILPFTSICRPKCPETTNKTISDSIFPRRKIPRRYPQLYHHNKHSSPLNPFYQNPKNPKNTKKTKNNDNKNKSSSRRNLFSSSSRDSAYFLEEEDEESWKGTFSSYSSGYRRETIHSRRRRRKTEKGEIGVSGKVKESFAVVKRSMDPYNDFRRSMVEMIVGKQIIAAYDLEQLLQCFLCLNSENHHRIIVDVFTEIYDVLFSNLS